MDAQVVFPLGHAWHEQHSLLNKATESDDDVSVGSPCIPPTNNVLTRSAGQRFCVLTGSSCDIHPVSHHCDSVHPDIHCYSQAVSQDLLPQNVH
jgi:hypothetical protein